MKQTTDETKCAKCGKEDCTCPKHEGSEFYDKDGYNWAEDTRKKRKKYDKK